MRYVLAVVDHGTFTNAAAAIPVTQPALSQGIRALEAELGVALFARVGRGVQLSDAGHAFVPHARQLMADVELIANAVARVARLETGTLDIVSLPTLAVTPLVELISGFRARYPGVRVRVREREGSADDAIQWVRNGTCELGLVELPGHKLQPGLVMHLLREQEYFAVCPPGTHAAMPGRLSIDELLALPIATTPPGTSSRRVLDEAVASAGLPMVAPAIESWHREQLAPLVLAGAAATILPAPMATQAQAQGAVVLPLDPPLRRSIGLVHRSSPLSPAAQTFMDEAVAS